MKTILSKLTILILVALTTTSCAIDVFNKVTGDRNVVTKDRNITADFTGIKVNTGLDLYITQGIENSVTVEADENLHAIIITEVKDGVLKIYSEKNIWRAKARKIHVTVINFNKLTATSGSDVYGNGTINTDEISISASSGADIKIAIAAKSVETSATSGSDIRISGTSENHASSATSGSSIKAFDLISENVIVKATSGADINIYASNRIEAKANSGGDIDFRGNPKKVNKKAT
jgi:hypothetical protein